VDSDSDGTIDFFDTDSDGDGIPDSLEGTLDSDSDGTLDYLETDANGDGIADSLQAVDSDSDGTYDFQEAFIPPEPVIIPEVVEITSTVGDKTKELVEAIPNTSDLLLIGVEEDSFEDYLNLNLSLDGVSEYSSPEFETIFEKYNDEVMTLHDVFNDHAPSDNLEEFRNQEEFYDFISQVVRYEIGLSSNGFSDDWSGVINQLDNVELSSEFLNDWGRIIQALDKEKLSSLIKFIDSESGFTETIESDIAGNNMDIDLSTLSDEQWLEMLIG